jgi:hypothetical protein
MAAPAGCRRRSPSPAERRSAAAHVQELPPPHPLEPPQPLEPPEQLLGDEQLVDEPDEQLFGVEQLDPWP